MTKSTVGYLTYNYSIMSRPCFYRILAAVMTSQRTDLKMADLKTCWRSFGWLGCRQRPSRVASGFGWLGWLGSGAMNRLDER
eukprot:COSAG02_NODE_2239_length_9411_cov_3.663552_10_plen_82_part_00